MTRHTANLRPGARHTVHYLATTTGPKVGTLLIDDGKLCVVGPACMWRRADGTDGDQGFELTYLGTCDEAGRLIEAYPEEYTYPSGLHDIRGFRVVEQEPGVLERYLARQRGVKARRAA